MKNSVLLSMFLVFGFAYGQTTANNSSAKAVIAPDTATVTLHPVAEARSNDPTLFGFEKHTVNGINYYYKKNENMSIVFIEEKK